MKRTTALKRYVSPVRRSPIRRVSRQRAKQNRIYAEKRSAFLVQHPTCQVWYTLFHSMNYDLMREIFGELPSRVNATEVHHKNKRHGARLNDEAQWMAVSRQGHAWIHAHPAEARELGWLL
jgi:hypothetical protein